MSSKKVPLRLQDIIENAGSIFQYTEGMDLETFERDRKTYDAIERYLERISEAVAKLGDVAPLLMPDQPWQKIRAFGNVLRHEYDYVEAEQLLKIVKTDLPGLRAAAERALEQWENREDS